MCKLYLFKNSQGKVFIYINKSTNKNINSFVKTFCFILLKILNSDDQVFFVCWKNCNYKNVAEQMLCWNQTACNSINITKEETAIFNIIFIYFFISIWWFHEMINGCISDSIDICKKYYEYKKVKRKTIQKKRFQYNSLLIIDTGQW